MYSVKSSKQAVSHVGALPYCFSAVV